MDEAQITRFQESLDRATADPEFLTRFYERFMGTSDEVAAIFAHTDMEQLKRKLKASLHILAAAPLGLVLDEVLYDVPGSDDGFEWIKLYNGTDQPIDLSGWSIGWGGNDYTWGVLQLEGIVPAGGCFLLGGPSASADNGNPVFDWAVNLEPDLQNSGSKADGIALFDVPASQVTSSTVPVDVVVYGGSNANNLLGPDGQPSPVHVPDAPAGQSLLRETADTWTINPAPNSVACPVPLP